MVRVPKEHRIWKILDHLNSKQRRTYTRKLHRRGLAVVEEVEQEAQALLNGKPQPTTDTHNIRNNTSGNHRNDNKENLNKVKMVQVDSLPSDVSNHTIVRNNNNSSKNPNAVVKIHDDDDNDNNNDDSKHDSDEKQVDGKTDNGVILIPQNTMKDASLISPSIVDESGRNLQIITSTTTPQSALLKKRTKTSGLLLKTPNTVPPTKRNTNDEYSRTTTTTTKPPETRTLAAIFGENIGEFASKSSEHHDEGDYTLIGDSPYETTYDPQSKFFYNRVYGNLYITTRSILFRGKSFGPMGAVPYERRMILPMEELWLVELYKSTSIRITMYDGETYIFKSFDSQTRTKITKLIQRTKQRFTNEHDSNSSFHHYFNNDVDNGDENSDTDSLPSAREHEVGMRRQERHHLQKRRSQSVDSLRSPIIALSSSLPTTPIQNSHICTTAPLSSPHRPRSFDDGEDDENGNEHSASEPRRLFGATTTSALLLSTTMSPPTNFISQRKLPTTPAVGNDNGGSSHNDDNGNTNRTNSSVGHTRSNSGMVVGDMLPSIPTVPSLDTPKLVKRKTSDSATASNSLLADGNTINTTTVPFTAENYDDNINDNEEQREIDRIRDLEVQKLWNEFKSNRNKQNKDNRTDDWNIAIESMVLPQCTMDDWFQLFFADDSSYSMKNYQISKVGDTNVKFGIWTTANNSSSIMFPEKIERKITYTHPLTGSIGPSKADTFRHQLLERYGKFGAVLTSKTTVGQNVPMGDCFHVEDEWIIEKQQQHHSHSNGNNKNDGERNTMLPPSVSLVLTVKFRLVFTKRTMLKSIITKNCASETTNWFAGYVKMIRNALRSKQNSNIIQKRHHSAANTGNENTAGASDAGTDTGATTIAQFSGNSSSSTKGPLPALRLPLPPLLEDTNKSAHQPNQQSEILIPVVADEINNDNNVKKVDDGNFINASNSGDYSNPTNSYQLPFMTLMIIVVFVVSLVVVLVSVLIYLLRMNMSMRDSIHSIEKQLYDLSIQNMLLLQRMDAESIIERD